MNENTVEVRLGNKGSNMLDLSGRVAAFERSGCNTTTFRLCRSFGARVGLEWKRHSKERGLS